MKRCKVVDLDWAEDVEAQQKKWLHFLLLLLLLSAFVFTYRTDLLCGLYVNLCKSQAYKFNFL